MTEAQYDNQADENAERERPIHHTPAIITLSNGLRVGNFSSPHSFTFEDGSILNAVSPADCLILSMNVEETVVAPHTIKVKFFTDKHINQELYDWLLDQKYGFVDIVIVPRPVIDMFRDRGDTDEALLLMPFRTIRLADRIKKINCIDKFCI